MFCNLSIIMYLEARDPIAVVLLTAKKYYRISIRLAINFHFTKRINFFYFFLFPALTF